MSYGNIFSKRRSIKIPTIFFLIVISFIVFFLSRIFSTKPISSRASKKILRRVTIVNLSYNQAGVFWQTDQKENGWLVYGDKKNKLDGIIFDEKDTIEKKSPYLNHYVLIKNLEQNHDYFFKIVSDNQLVIDVDNQAFSFHTPANISAFSNISPAYGKVIGANGIPPTSGVVILTFKNTYSLLTLLKLSGEWLIPLNNVVDKNSSRVRNLETSEIGTVEIYSEEGQKTTIETVTENLSPVPQTVIMGKDYSFVTTNNVLSASDKKMSDGKKPDIIFPKEQGIIPGESPLIKGTAVPGSEVTVIINSKTTYSIRVKADKNGIWRVVPKDKLSPGQHTLTVIGKNEKGEEIRLTRQFTIAKSGEQVLGEATPEPTLTTPTSIPSISFTPVPTIKKTGSSPFPIAVTAGSLIVIGLGIILAF